MLLGRDDNNVADNDSQGPMSAIKEPALEEHELEKAVEERENQHGRRSALDQLLTNRIG